VCVCAGVVVAVRVGCAGQALQHQQLQSWVCCWGLGAGVVGVTLRPHVCTRSFAGGAPSP
jgi:hypothetical protein